jgi:hypothetical protein
VLSKQDAQRPPASAAGRTLTRTLEWEGHSIEMRVFFSPRLLMIATDTTLSIDGRLVARKGGLGFTETAAAWFDHRGRDVWSELQVRGSPSVFTKIPYVLRFNGLPVSTGKLKLEGLAPAVVVWLTAAGLLILLALAV